MRSRSIVAVATTGPSLPLLFDLGLLHRFIVVSRPSISVRTPYVADLLSDTEEVRGLTRTHFMERCSTYRSQKDKVDALKSLSTELRNLGNRKEETIVLGHTPSLDCAGMIIPGSTVCCTKNLSTTTSKTAYSVQLCEELRDDEQNYVTVGCHPALAERAAGRLLELQLLPELGPYDVDNICTQQTYGRSRVDFTLSNADLDGSITLVEVKNCVGADYCEGLVPAGRSDVGVYTRPAEGYLRHAIFPHGHKKPGVGVVSDRAIKHIHELTNLHGTVDGTTGKAISAAILFIVNRSDCAAFRPCHEACLLFAQVLLRAHLRGLTLIAKELVWCDGKCHAGRTLPVVFDSSVNASDIDELFLQKVLTFNEGGSGRSRTTMPLSTYNKNNSTAHKASVSATSTSSSIQRAKVRGSSKMKRKAAKA
jgi:DNA-binding sugar fermentation-stimulating protein